MSAHRQTLSFQRQITVFLPEFTGQRAQIVPHDHAHHLECSDCEYQTLVENNNLCGTYVLGTCCMLV